MLKYLFIGVLTVRFYDATNLFHSRHTHSASDVGMYGAILFFCGWWLFFKGFRKYKEKKTLESIPRSKIRSMAIGPVEIEGMASAVKPLNAPFSSQPCVYFSYLIEQKVQSGKSSYWKTVLKGDSSGDPFIVKDETGSVKVAPVNAEIKLNKVNEYQQTTFSSNVPEEAVILLANSGFNSQGFLGMAKTLRFQEWLITPQQKVFVAGVAVSRRPDPVIQKSELLTKRLMQVKRDPSLMKRYDVNHDGTVSVEEWDQARAEAEWAVEQELLTLVEDPLDQIVVTGSADNYFVISTQDEPAFISALGWNALAMIFGGPAIAVVGAYLLSGIFH